MTAGKIVFAGVSKFYGEILGVNRVDLTLGPGVTSLVGPNGAGKTTLLNLMTGLVRPSRGAIHVLGVPVGDAERIGRLVGYCSQVDSFPPGATGRGFVTRCLRLAGAPAGEAGRRADAVLDQVGLTEAAGRRIAGYSKGMRQRVKLAGALAHGPRVLALDEPLNGLDPLARAEMAALFRALADDGCCVVLSSHILHEVDALTDRVVVINHGYVMAEGGVPDVRAGVAATHPHAVLVRCDEPGRLAQALLARDHVVEIRMHDDRRGLVVRTRDAEGFYQALGEIALADALEIDTVVPVDDDVHAVYRYLVDVEGGGA